MYYLFEFLTQAEQLEIKTCKCSKIYAILISNLKVGFQEHAYQFTHLKGRLFQFFNLVFKSFIIYFMVNEWN